MKILLVSDDKNLAENIKEKLVFLRKDDKVVISPYCNALQEVELSSANLVLLQENSEQDDTILLIKDLRTKYGNLCILLLVNTCSPEFILKATDAGANDFINVSAENFEYVIRLVNYIKQTSIQTSLNRNYELLKQLKVVNELTGIYEYSYSKQVIENTLDSELITNGSFMAIAPSKRGKTKFSAEELAASITQSVRSKDIVTHGKGTNFYVFLPDTDMNGAAAVYEKIKEKLKFETCAGICDITDCQFNKFEKKALKALTNAIPTNTSIIFAEDSQKETLDDWLDRDSNKNYKIFRQMFNKKLEKVITPVFYRLQKVYEEKLFDTNIEQFVDEEQCVFNLQNKNYSSSLKIIYPGFAKIIISITHDGLDSPENREIHLQLANVTQHEIVEIVEDFIKEFKSRG